MSSTKRLKRRLHVLSTLGVALGWCAFTGCGQVQRIFHIPRANVALAEPRGVIDDPVPPAIQLASFVPDQEAGDASSTMRQSVDASSPAEPVGSNGVAGAMPAYTSPRFPVFALLTLTTPASWFAVDGNVNVAFVGGNALVSDAQGVVGRAGLTAPSATIGTTLVSRPGLQEGAATGLNFAAPGRNLFARQRNPLTGANGRCAELSRAGFFGGDRAACERAGRR